MHGLPACLDKATCIDGVLDKFAPRSSNTRFQLQILSEETHTQYNHSPSGTCMRKFDCRWASVRVNRIIRQETSNGVEFLKKYINLPEIRACNHRPCDLYKATAFVWRRKGVLVQSEPGRQLRRIHHAREVDVTSLKEIRERTIEPLFLASAFICILIERPGLRLRFLVRILRWPRSSQQCPASEILVGHKAGQPPIYHLLFVHRLPGRRIAPSGVGFVSFIISWGSNPGQDDRSLDPRLPCLRREEDMEPGFVLLQLLLLLYVFSFSVFILVLLP